jgi:hypothetical protein
MTTFPSSVDVTLAHTQLNEGLGHLLNLREDAIEARAAAKPSARSGTQSLKIDINIFQIARTDEMDEMEERDVVFFLRLKGLFKKSIHHALVAVLQENAISFSSSSLTGINRGLFWA